MSAHQYANVKEALKDLSEAYNYWSGKLTETSTVFALSLIAANWAAFGPVGLKALLLPRLSVVCALLTLFAGLIVAQLMVYEHDRQHEYAEAESKRWEAEFETAKSDGSPNPWPYTKKVEQIGSWGRLLKFWLPILGCIFFIISFV